MKTHEKFLAVLVAATVLAAVTAPRWWPASAATGAHRAGPTAADPSDVSPARHVPERVPPHDPSQFARHLQSPHYTIDSNATAAQTQDVGARLEALHAAYVAMFADRLPKDGAPEPRHVVALYRDRADFRAHNTSRAWAEGFYRKPVCHAYYDADAANATHWIVHEGTHQLDAELARFPRTPWVGEALATYLGTSRIVDGELHPGELDPDTYPLWWLDALDLSGDLEADLARHRVVPLRELIDEDGPPLPGDVNRYYVGYWSLAHYLMHGDGGIHADAFRALVAEGGTLEQFEKRVGPVERVQKAWYAHLLAQVAAHRERPDDGAPDVILVR